MCFALLSEIVIWHALPCGRSKIVKGGIFEWLFSSAFRYFSMYSYMDLLMIASEQHRGGLISMQIVVHFIDDSIMFHLLL